MCSFNMSIDTGKAARQERIPFQGEGISLCEQRRALTRDFISEEILQLPENSCSIKTFFEST